MKKTKTKSKLSFNKIPILVLQAAQAGLVFGGGSSDPKTGYACMDASWPTYCYVITKPVTTTKVD